MNTRRVREEVALKMQNGGLTTQHDTEKRRESFLIWPIFDWNFNVQMGKSFNFIQYYVFIFMIRGDPVRLLYLPNLISSKITRYVMLSSSCSVISVLSRHNL